MRETHEKRGKHETNAGPPTFRLAAESSQSRVDHRPLGSARLVPTVERSSLYRHL